MVPKLERQSCFFSKLINDQYVLVNLEILETNFVRKQEFATRSLRNKTLLQGWTPIQVRNSSIYETLFRQNQQYVPYKLFKTVLQ